MMRVREVVSGAAGRGLALIRTGPADDLAVLTSADALILTNSTFSYWGGHLNGAHRGGGDPAIVAPAFHARGQSTGDRSWHLDPDWCVVEELPGGWAERGGVER